MVAAYIEKEWIYFILTLLMIVASPAYHYADDFQPKESRFYSYSRKLDWTVAVCGYLYGFYYIYEKVRTPMQIPLAFALVATLVFFWYGFRVSGYRKLHPWFHVTTSLLSALIVISK